MICEPLGHDQGIQRSSYRCGVKALTIYFAPYTGGGNSADTLGLGLAIRGVLLEKIDDEAGNIDAGRPLDAFQAGRGIDLHDQRPMAGADHIDAADVEAERRRRAGGHLLFLVGKLDLHGGSAPMQVGTELARTADPLVGCHNLAADDQRADIAAVRLADELLNHDVHVVGAERFDDRLGRALGLGENDAHALGALEQLDDDGDAADLLDHVLGFAWAVGEGGHRQADTFTRQQLQRAQLVARAPDGDALVQRVDALHLELAQHGEAVVRDGSADARDDGIVDRQAAPVVAQHWLVGGDVHMNVEGIDHVDRVPARAGRLAQPDVRVQMRIAGEHHEAHRAPLEPNPY